METPKIFADGLTWKDPNEKAPKWVKGQLFINAQRFRKFMEDNVQHISGKGWFTIDMKESTKGVIYFELNTWKPNSGTNPNPIAFSEPTSTMTSPGANGEIHDVSEIPF